MMRTVLLIVSVTAMAFLFGCASKPVIQTQVIEKLVPVSCEVEMPAECKEAYAVDRVPPADNALTINRADAEKRVQELRENASGNWSSRMLRKSGWS